MRWLPVLLLVAACASGPTLDERLRPLVGQEEAALVRALGIPAATHETGGERFLQYEDRSTAIYPGDPYSGRPYRRFAPGAPPPLVLLRSCTVTFALRGGTVTGFTYRGNDCR